MSKTEFKMPTADELSHETLRELYRAIPLNVRITSWLKYLADTLEIFPKSWKTEVSGRGNLKVTTKNGLTMVVNHRVSTFSNGHQKFGFVIHRGDSRARLPNNHFNDPLEALRGLARMARQIEKDYPGSFMHRPDQEEQ